MSNSYDLTVAYRIYPGVSKTPAIYAQDKYKLAELCLSSFKKSLGSLKVKMIVLLDNCPNKYEDLFKKYFEEKDLELIKLEGVGNQKTFALQIELLLMQEYSELLYFAEDDYYYLPNQFEKMCSFIMEFDDVNFISPYDHLDYYTLTLHKQPHFVRIHADRHWRTVGTTCLTFMTTKAKLKIAQKVFNSYLYRGGNDASLWMSLTKTNIFNPVKMIKIMITDNKYWKIPLLSWYCCWRHILFGQKLKLWVPIPSIATHIEKAHLAPTYNWKDIFIK